MAASVPEAEVVAGVRRRGKQLHGGRSAGASGGGRPGREQRPGGADYCLLHPPRACHLSLLPLPPLARRTAHRRRRGGGGAAGGPPQTSRCRGAPRR
ncbi:hypothetical protein EE612_051243 [Oryza sativa]|nr:hypothetical protein EE612_051243 [Oryza sativa]